MNFNNKTYKVETVRELQKEQAKLGIEKPIVNGGYPLFNVCEHTTIDMTTIPKNDMHTLSIKLTDDTYITLCVMPMNNGNYVNIDTKFHSDNENRKHSLIHFSMKGVAVDDTRVSDMNLTALVTENKGGQ